MIEVELIPTTDPVPAIETLAVRLGLTKTTGELKKYPGSTHWHFRIPGHSGTLECTWWPSMNRLWLAVHGNRQADWQDPVIQAFTTSFGAFRPS
jgi:hypothetical protein